MKAILEIRAGEGGDDAKLFVQDMVRMYTKYFERNKISHSLISDSSSEVIIEISGNIGQLAYESGVHRVQRVPPTENRGRRHSSTLTVAILPIANGNFHFDSTDVEIRAFKASGKGGQHRNKVETAIRAVHLPTGITATCARERSKHMNERLALRVLAARVLSKQKLEETKRIKDKRIEQIGRGGRAEKIRTYNFIENRVKDARIRKALYCLDKIMDGRLDLIYKSMQK
jgi:peptide chain release factor 1